MSDPHIVANYLKRLLRESYMPLIPEEQNDAFLNLGTEINAAGVKEIVKSLPALNRNILQLLAKLFKHVVQFEPFNKMTSYNMAITIGPNIFRSEHEDSDLSSQSVFYQVLILMIDEYEEIFDDEFNSVFAQRLLDNQATEEAQNIGPGPLPPQEIEQQPRQE